MSRILRLDNKLYYIKPQLPLLICISFPCYYHFSWVPVSNVKIIDVAIDIENAKIANFGVIIENHRSHAW